VDSGPNTKKPLSGNKLDLVIPSYLE